MDVKLSLFSLAFCTSFSFKYFMCVNKSNKNKNENDERKILSTIIKL